MNFTNLFKFTFLLLIGISAGFYFLTYEKMDRAFAGTPSPCEDPLSYKIGEIDSRFGLSEREVEEAMQAAAALWSDGVGRPVAITSNDGDIDVTFIYDGRQQMVDGEMRFRERINSENIRMNQLQQDYEREREVFDQRSANYVELANEASQALNELNSWVEEKNDSGGFREDDVSVFETRKESVERLQQRVGRERSELDKMAEQINRDTDQLNRLIDQNNQLVEEYNEEYSGEGRFTKATYQNLSDGGVITVNMFLNKKELTLILAHELGHALGMDHVSNPKSVMYSQMGQQELFPVVQLTREDLNAIKESCGRRGLSR